MTISSFPVSASEQARLDDCVKEQIRRPGLIQAHGVMLTADRTTWAIVQASENSHAVVGRSAQDLIGSSLAELIGDAAVDRIAAVLAGKFGAANPVPVVCHAVPFDAGSFDAIAHIADGVAVVELEPVLPPGDFSSVPELYAALNRLGRCVSREQLWEDTAREVHRLTGFDRVMVYHFHSDGHGQVVAEERSDASMEPYLGLHYPASDIPAQARDLYLTKISRTIASTQSTSVPLFPPESPVTGEPLDLSGAELRSVSPHHSRFMQNMGQGATVSLSLVVNGELAGMITCAHRTPRRLPYTLRQALEVLAGRVALQLGSLAEVRRLARVNELLLLRKELVSQFSSSGDPVEALLHGPITMFDLVPASGAAIQHEGRISTAGEVKDRTRVEEFVERLLARGGTLPFASEALASEHPELAEILPEFAGVLIVPFGPDGNFLAWFRPEMTETVNWLGDQSEANRDSIFSPRNSFAMWSGSVSGLAEPWGTVQAAALELGFDLDSAFLRIVESQLARYALHDTLTGLPNRRLFMDRLEHALAGHARGGHVAVLFIDIDTFKTFNDTLGHDGGDAVLTQIAQRLLGSARASDTVARLGGDEFVILCEDTEAEAPRLLSERVLAALRPPLTFDGRDVQVAASVGFALAQVGDTASELVSRADAAMYRAKGGGKNRVAE